MQATQSALLARIERFSLDEPGAALTFSQRLARENGWSPKFTRRVIREYKRFAFLAMVAGRPVSPSDAVDQAWHLHLCYTENYWKEFCRETLGGPLHHGPTKGGAVEQEKHVDWYEKTLAAYREWFGEEPPSEIWPPATERFHHGSRFVRVDAREHWIIPKPRWLPVARVAAVLTAAAFVVSGCRAMFAGTLPVFDLPGPQFLRFYLIFAPAVLLGAGLLRRRLRQPAEMAPAEELPNDPFTVACLAEGPIHAVNVAVVSLAHRGLVEVRDRGELIRTGAPASANVLTPLENDIWIRLKDADTTKMRDLRPKVQKEVNAMIEDLRAREMVTTEAQVRQVRAQTFFLAVLAPLVGVIKIGVGIARERPVGYLAWLTAAAAIAAVLIGLTKPFRTRKGDAVLRLLHKQHSKMEFGDFFRANSALSPEMFTFAVGLFGMEILSDTVYAHLQTSLTPPPSPSASVCSSSCGNSCGGGGCGGGGCGGCGGGD